VVNFIQSHRRYESYGCRLGPTDSSIGVRKVRRHCAANRL
jgi:hypothetical protein